MAESVELALSAAGAPLRVRRNGRTWRVAAEPIRWFERVPWWDTETRMQKGGGISIEVKVWRLQVRLNPASELVTWEIITEPNTGRCWLRSENGIQL